eukprot:gene33015-55010_t
MRVRDAAAAAAAGAAAAEATTVVLAAVWGFPVPLTMFWAAPPMLAAFWVCVWRAAPPAARRAARDDWGRLGRRVAAIFLIILFVGVFGVYRYGFQEVGARDAAWQALAGACFPLIKVALKVAGQYLMFTGGDPDLQPFASGVYDFLAALCGNFLFASATSWATVGLMIAVDIAENTLYTMRAVTAFLEAEAERGTKAQIDDAERRILAQVAQVARNTARQRRTIASLLERLER